MGSLCCDENRAIEKKKTMKNKKIKNKNEGRKKNTGWMWMIHWSVDGLGNHRQKKKQV